MAKIINPRRFIISILLVSLMVGFGGFKLYQLGKSFWGYGNSIYEKISTIEIDKNNKNNQLKSVGFNNMMVVYHNNSLRAYSVEGMEKWTLGQKIDKPQLYGGGNLLYLIDQDAGFTSAIDQNGKIIWTLDLGQGIQEFTAGDSIIAMVIEGEDENGEVLLYNNKGEKLGEINIKSSTIMDLTVTNDGEIIALSLLTTENDVIETNIVLYSKEGKLVGGNKYDDLIGNMFFSRDNRLISVGVEHIVAFHKEKGLLWKKDTQDSINKISWNGKELLAINSINEKKSILDMGHKSYIYIMDMKGNKRGEIPLKGIVVDMDFMGEKVVAAGERTLYFSGKNLNEVVEKRIHKDIKEVFFLKENILAVITEDTIELLSVE